MSDTEMADAPGPEPPPDFADTNLNAGTPSPKVRVNLEPSDHLNTSHPLPKMTPKTPKAPTPELRQLSSAELKTAEIPSEVYAEYFHSLQLKPEKWDDFFTFIVKLVRNKHFVDLKRGTAASIKNLSFVLLRGYGSHVWQRPKSREWLRELEEGEERFEHVKKGENERLYNLLEPLWWKMRDTIFAIRPAVKKRTPASTKKESNKITSATRRDAEDKNYEGDADTEVGNSRHSTPFTLHIPSPPSLVRAQTAHRIKEMEDKLPQPDLTVYGNKYMSADATEEAIVKLTVSLHQICANSHPDVFARLWEANVTRVEEGDEPDRKENEQEVIGSDYTVVEERDAMEALVGQTDRIPAARSTRAGANLSNEPFASQGAPSKPSFPLPALLPPRLPETMTIYISTSPSTNAAYQQRSYVWLDAPVKPNDMLAFFRGADLRVDMLEEDVNGFSFSYGWNDMCRWIQNGSRKQTGWNAFQRDLTRAAEYGVEVWRMKVLVVGR